MIGRYSMLNESVADNAENIIIEEKLYSKTMDEVARLVDQVRKGLKVLLNPSDAVTGENS